MDSVRSNLRTADMGAPEKAGLKRSDSSMGRPHSAIKKHLVNSNSAQINACLYDRLMKPEPGLVRKLLGEEKDDRYRYLLKHSKVHFIEAGSYSLYVELPQIPNVLIVYRRPSERLQNPEKLNLDHRNLSHIPLLEGEEKIKSINLKDNKISKIANLVSIPNL